MWLQNILVTYILFYFTLYVLESPYTKEKEWNINPRLVRPNQVVSGAATEISRRLDDHYRTEE